MSNELQAHYGGAVPAGTIGQSSNSMTQVAQAREVAQVQAAIICARQMPRNEQAAIQRIMNACSRPGLAAHALYQYAKGGTDITGPSIRMAEAIAQNWGNLDFGFREVSQANGESTVEAYAWDLETNVRQTKVFQVPHIRHTKAGAYPVKDPREVYEMIANQAARRVRACILGIIPGDVIEQAVTQCESTLKTSTPVTPEQVKKMVESFATKGVTKSQIEKRIQRSLDAITPAQMVSLRKIFNSLNDGMSAPADWFDAEAPKATGKKHTLKEALTPPADREPGEEG